ncbi:hypothetical protein [Deinococcus navajonensis]|uniref:Uncharacterized protein n=1 Tax=Deinococcus navajonensis TaxID=309884 RepID=A0ABV8XLS1_9DEIO
MTASPVSAPLRHTVYLSPAPQASHARLRRGHRIIRHSRLSAQRAPARAGLAWTLRGWLTAALRAWHPAGAQAERLHARTFAQRALRHETEQRPQFVLLAGRLVELSPVRGFQGEAP